MNENVGGYGDDVDGYGGGPDREEHSSKADDIERDIGHARIFRTRIRCSNDLAAVRRGREAAEVTSYAPLLLVKRPRPPGILESFGSGTPYPAAPN